jgi:hypothetical protein
LSPDNESHFLRTKTELRGARAAHAVGYAPWQLLLNDLP